MILTIPWNVSLKNVDVWFQDEARFGQRIEPALKQQQFEYAYLFGAVFPSTGATEAFISPVMNMDVMEQNLALISQKTKDGRHAWMH